MTERPPAVDLGKYSGEEPTVGCFVSTGPHGKAFLEDMDAILADLEATRRELHNMHLLVRQLHAENNQLKQELAMLRRRNGDG